MASRAAATRLKMVAKARVTALQKPITTDCLSVSLSNFSHSVLLTLTHSAAAPKLTPAPRAWSQVAGVARLTSPDGPGAGQEMRPS